MSNTWCAAQVVPEIKASKDDSQAVSKDAASKDAQIEQATSLLTATAAASTGSTDEASA